MVTASALRLGPGGKAPGGGMRGERGVHAAASYTWCQATRSMGLATVVAAKALLWYFSNRA